MVAAIQLANYSGSSASVSCDPVSLDRPNSIVEVALPPPTNLGSFRRKNSMNDAWIGKIIGGCRLECLIGKGGMGAVYLAHQLHLDRKVAMKILSPARLGSCTEQQNTIKRFQREARLAARLQHANAVQIYDFGEDNNVYYIVMQYIRGITLEQLLQKSGPLAVAQCLHVIKEVARALQAAHEQGIIHRDIKPANIMIRRDKTIVVTDFGLAKAAHILSTISVVGGCIGTLGYMPPEQTTGEKDVDHRADIYSLGATSFYLLTGHCPFEGNNAMAVIYKQALAQPPDIQQFRQDIAESVIAIIQRMMAHDPNQRWQSASELLTAVTEVEATGLSQEIKTMPNQAPMPGRRKKHRTVTQLLAPPLLPGEQQLANRVSNFLGIRENNHCQKKDCPQEWAPAQIIDKKALIFHREIWCRECLWQELPHKMAGGRIGKLESGHLGDYWLSIKAVDEFLPGEPVRILYRFPLQRSKKNWNIMLQRIKRGFSLIRKIHSNNLIRVGSYTECPEHGIAYVPLEYVSGVTLDRLSIHIAENGQKLELAEIIALLRKLAQAMSVLHRANIVHRNITPRGIYLSLNGGVRLGNFSMAKPFAGREDLSLGASNIFEAIEALQENGADPHSQEVGEITTNFNSVIGTVAYMSPEQTISSIQIDQRSDIWSWGIVAYELLAGRRPFPENNIWDTVQAIRDGDTPDFDVAIPQVLQNIISRALTRDVEQRCQSANEIVRALDLAKLKR